MNKIFWILVVLMAVVTTSCRNKIDSMLDSIEELSYTNPDSALTIIDSIYISDIAGKDRQARFCLFKSRVLDRCYIDIADDSMISIAANYYEKQGNTKYNMLAHYYLGVVYHNAKDYSKSLVAFSKAHDIAKFFDDKYWVAMSSSMESDIYKKTYHSAEELRTTKESYENFLLSGKQDYIPRSMLDLATAYSNNAQFDKCISLCKEIIDSARINHSIDVETDATRSMAYAYFFNNNYLDAIPLLERLCDSQFVRSQDKVYLGISYLETTEQEKAVAIMKDCLADTYLESYLRYQVYKKIGQPIEALKALEIAYDQSEKSLMAEFDRNLTGSLTNYYEHNHELSEARLRTSRYTIGIIISLSVAIIAIIVITMYYHHKRQQRKIDENFEIACNLREIINLKDRECLETQDTIFELINSKFEVLDRLCASYYENEKNPTIAKKRIAQEVSELISQFSIDSDKVNEVEAYVNQHYFNIMSDVRKDLPGLKEIDYRLFLYSILGFSTNAIALFFKEEKLTAIYERKRRLKIKIKTLNSKNRDTYLKFLS